jgi:hypothetical protein
LRAAKAWGLSPSQWRAETVDDRALMLAFVLFEGTIEAYRYESGKLTAESRNGKGKADEGMFSAMKRRLKN